MSTASTALAVTVVIPARDDGATVGDTVRSLRAQTRQPAEIIVVDCGSTDGTAAVARAAGARVVSPPTRMASRAAAQNFALLLVKTPLVMALEPDTGLDQEAIEKLVPSVAAPGVAAASGFVLPRRVRTLCERGRHLEHLLASAAGRPFVDAGCFTLFRTDALRALDGWPERGPAGDQDLMWSLGRSGYEIRFVDDAVAHPAGPCSLPYLRHQLRAWAASFARNLRRHWRAVPDAPQLRSAVAAALWDGLVAPLLFVIALPLAIVLLGEPWLLLAYAVELPALLAPLAAGTVPMRDAARALAGLPAFSMLRTLGALYLLREALATGLRRRRSSRERRAWRRAEAGRPWLAAPRPAEDASARRR